MLRSLNEMIGYSLKATDGEIGRCEDFLFEDRPWVIRYMVAKTEKWFLENHVLLSLINFKSPEWSNRLFHVSLTKEQIRNSLPLEADAPVSMIENQSYLYYGWPAYWAQNSRDQERESSLRSANEVRGYSVQGSEGKIGKISDFIVDDSIWAIRYIVVETEERLGGKKVLTAPEWASSIDWTRQTVQIDLLDESVKNCPEYNPAEPVNRDYESILSNYYGRPYYWVEKTD
jgi:hypothetical protein